jgi:hypothetical protein
MTLLQGEVSRSHRLWPRHTGAVSPPWRAPMYRSLNVMGGTARIPHHEHAVPRRGGVDGWQPRRNQPEAQGCDAAQRRRSVGPGDMCVTAGCFTGRNYSVLRRRSGMALAFASFRQVLRAVRLTCETGMRDMPMGEASRRRFSTDCPCERSGHQPRAGPTL